MEEVKMEIPKTKESTIEEFTVHYADGSGKVIRRGLLITESGEDIEILGLQLSVEDYLMALSAMQQALDKILELE